ncbi:uncharacterized protein UTRI_03907 [Ustilago trichophora]|uniref:Uncharacterized protein n=1 Tax=Ustilago trichophora TaxID=86804 RepID=A0A5C3E766_9BASI|nr:uncharacterized protein UTRI_03907 [Ustilago trichophora]
MQPAPPFAATAAQPTNPRGWLPAKAQLSIKSRLFSKNILYSRDLWARGTATWTSTFIFAALLILIAYILYLWLTVAHGSLAQTKPLWQLSTMLADDATINRLDAELDSDEYEDEEDSSRSAGFLASSKEREVLRRMLGRNEHGLTKRSSIVRITSSDPTSSLCENPMQFDLESTTRRSFWPAPVTNTTPSDSSVPNSPTTASSALNATGSPTLGGAATTRRRKESGRLLSAETGRRQHTASPSRSPLASGAALPVRPTRVRPVDARSPLGRKNKRSSTSSLSSADGTTNSPRPSLKKAGREESWTDETPTPTLSPDREDVEMLGSPSMASEASFTSAAVDPTPDGGDHPDAPATPLACSSPTSSTFSIGRAPSILKRRPQTFRTASLREIDISYSLMQRKTSLSAFSMPLADPSLLQQQQQQQQQQELLQANGMFLPLASPAPPPYAPSNPDLPSSPTNEAKPKSVKLIEPDWRPHIDSHIRARERLETATRFAALRMAQHSSKFDESNDVVDVDDFWFERFTQSTAAAGRDWDWRKRRARLQRAAALGMALGQSGLAAAAPPQIPATNLPSNVGKTDVQLQHQGPGAGAEPMPATQAASPTRKVLPSAPLITFTEQELQSAPILKIDTETGRRTALQPRHEASNSSPTMPNGTPLSPTPSGTGTPLGGIFGAVFPSADTVSAAMAARMAQRRRASEDATSARGSRITRRRLSASAAAGMPTSPGGGGGGSPSTEALAGSPLRDQVSPSSSSSPSPSPLAASPSHSGDTSIPGRLSSLGGTVGKRVSLTNLRAGFRRNSGSGATAGTGGFLQDASGIELVPNSPEFNTGDDAEGMRYLDETPTSSPEGPRSSADMYSGYNWRPPSARVGESVALSRTDSRLRSMETSVETLSQSQSQSQSQSATRNQPPAKKTASFLGGTPFNRQTSAPPSSGYYDQQEILEELRADFDPDALSHSHSSNASLDSSSSDSLRRKMRSRSRSQTESSSSPLSRNGPLSVRKEGYSSVSTVATVQTTKGRGMRSGSRSSIMRSASSAVLERRKGDSDSGSISSSRNGSIRRGSPKFNRLQHGMTITDPKMQPEVAPRGMIQRARSASLSSSNSGVSGGGGGGTSSRKNSFVRDQNGMIAGGGGGGLGLTMIHSGLDVTMMSTGKGG